MWSNDAKFHQKCKVFFVDKTLFAFIIYIVKWEEQNLQEIKTPDYLSPQYYIKSWRNQRRVGQRKWQLRYYSGYTLLTLLINQGNHFWNRPFIFKNCSYIYLLCYKTIEYDINELKLFDLISNWRLKWLHD